MAHQATVKRLTEAATAYWTGNWQRWKKAVIKYRGPGYKGDDLSQDVIGFWVDTFDAACKFFPNVGAPTLPFAVFRYPQNSYNTSPGVEDSVFLSFMVPGGSTPVVSALEKLGGGTAIPSGAVTLRLDAERTVLTVTILTAAGTPAAGTYQGIVTVDGVPLAMIVAEVL